MSAVQTSLSSASAGSGRAPSAEDLVARAQELVDAGPGEAGHSLEWAVPAYFLGDMSTLARFSLRSES